MKLGKEVLKRSHLMCLSFSIISLLFMVCLKKGVNPISPDGNYTPQLLDPVGTVYVGIYFPLRSGLTWKYSGTEIEYTNTHTTIKGQQGVWFDTTEIDTSTMTLSTTRQIQTQQTISISGNNYTVMPIITRTIITQNDSSDTMDITGYYESQDSIIVIRAIVMKINSGFDTIPTGNSIVSRNPLVVGNKWETAPSYGLSSLALETGNNIKDLKIHGTTYVIGKDTISFNGENVKTLRLDQAFQISYSVSDSESTTKVSSNGVSKLYMIKDTGEIKEVQDQNITMNLTMILQGDTATSNITATLTFSEALTTFATSAMPLAKSIVNSTEAPIKLTIYTVIPKQQQLSKIQRKALLKAALICKQFTATF